MSKLKRKFGKRLKYNYKRTFIGLFLFVFVLLFGIGYAYLTTNLSIDGTSHVKSARWDVHFDNVANNYAYHATVLQEPTISEKTTLSFGVSLDEPGANYKFTVDIKNDGTIPAEVSDVNISPELTDEQKQYLSYNITYDGGMPFPDTFVIGADQVVTLFVSLEYKEDSLLDEDFSLEPSITIQVNQYSSEQSTRNVCFLKPHTVHEEGTDIYTKYMTKEIIETNTSEPPVISDIVGCERRYISYFIDNDNLSCMDDGSCNDIDLAKYTTEGHVIFGPTVYARLPEEEGCYSTICIPCLAGETEVEVYNKKKKKRMRKKLRDVTEDDLLLVWNFDKGDYDYIEPLWIAKTDLADHYHLLKFSDGSFLKVIRDHRIFNADLNKFTRVMDDNESPIGMRTFNSKGELIELVSKETIFEKIDYCNVITKKHINFFGNGILTSWRVNNIYPIKDMKFVKDDRKLREKSEFPEIDDEWFEGLRISESPDSKEQIISDYEYCKERKK